MLIKDYCSCAFIFGENKDTGRVDVVFGNSGCDLVSSVSREQAALIIGIINEKTAAIEHLLDRLGARGVFYDFINAQPVHCYLLDNIQLPAEKTK